MPAEERSGVRATWFDFQFFSASIFQRGPRHPLSNSTVLNRRRHFCVVDDHLIVVYTVLKQAEHIADVQFELLCRRIVYNVCGSNGAGFSHSNVGRRPPRVTYSFISEGSVCEKRRASSACSITTEGSR